MSKNTVQFQKGMSLPNFMAQYGTEQQCREEVFKAKWPKGFSERFDGLAALISLPALLALLRYKAGVIPVIVASGAAGFLVTFIKPWLVQVGVLS
jgi:hypothetical protein